MTREELASEMAARELAALSWEQRESLLMDWWTLVGRARKELREAFVRHEGDGAEAG